MKKVTTHSATLPPGTRTGVLGPEQRDGRYGLQTRSNDVADDMRVLRHDRYKIGYEDRLAARRCLG